MGSWTCAPCKREFMSQNARAAHYYDSPRHPRCEPCKRGFPDHQSRLQHMRTATVHAGRYCNSCDRVFADQQALRQHRLHAAVHLYAYEDSAGDSDNDTVYDDASAPSISSGESYNGESALDVALYAFHDNLRQSEDFPNATWWYHPSAASPSEASIWDDESSSAGEDSSYLNASSDDSDGDEESDGDSNSLLEQSSDSDSDTSESPPTTLTLDLYRSTITHTRNPSSSPPASIPDLVSQITPPPPSTSLSRASFSTDTTDSSSATLITEAQPASSPANTDIVRSGSQKGKASGSGYTCPLCLEQDGDPALELSSVKCGHVFCTPCITRALERKRQCPVCRAHAKMKHIRRIFFNF